MVSIILVSCSRLSHNSKMNLPSLLQPLFLSLAGILSPHGLDSPNILGAKYPQQSKGHNKTSLGGLGVILLFRFPKIKNKPGLSFLKF